jgi:hypothetical protein
MLLSCGSRTGARITSPYLYAERGGADSLGNYSPPRPRVSLPSELQKRQHPQEHANVQADEHADA